MTEPVHNISLAQFTHYKIGGKARDVYFPATTDDLVAIFSLLRDGGSSYFVLGGGSNVLIGEGFWDGAVIVTRDLTGSEAQSDRIVCGAGLQSSKIAEIAHENGKTGLEFLYMLPGSIGGALAGNARYDMKNVSDVLHTVTAVHPEHGLRIFASEEITFGYKFTNIVREGWIIGDVSLAWRDGDSAAIKETMDTIEKNRTETRQFEYPSCGCVFKNDYEHNIRAGRLIDSLGLKGLSVGGARVADFHANFIVNTGNATARNVLDLIERIEYTVYIQMGIRLDREVRLLGTFSE